MHSKDPGRLESSLGPAGAEPGDPASAGGRMRRAVARLGGSVLLATALLTGAPPSSRGQAEGGIQALFSQAEKGDVQALDELGVRYREGRGVPRSLGTPRPSR